jgi:hypothetical protein
MAMVEPDEITPCDASNRVTPAQFLPCAPSMVHALVLLFCGESI